MDKLDKLVKDFKLLRAVFLGLKERKGKLVIIELCLTKAKKKGHKESRYS